MPGRIPRLSFDQLPTAIAERLQTKYQRLGYLGEFFAATAHQADALAAFIDFTVAAKGGLDIRIVELIALTVSTMQQVDYERNQHERLAVKLGFGADWVAEVERLAPDDADLKFLEQAVQRLVIAAVRNDGRGVTAELDAVVDLLGVADAVAVLMVMARYRTHAMLVNCLAIEPSVESIFPRDAVVPETRKHPDD